MTENAIRVQLPGGAVYAPAFDEAAAKVGARCGLAKKHSTTLTKLVHAAVAMLNSADATMITLQMVVGDESISTKITGKGAATPTKRSTNELHKLADKRASVFESTSTKAATVVSFET